MEKNKIKFTCKICGKDVEKEILDFPYCRDCISEYKLSITKKCSLPKPLISGKYYTLATNIQIREAKDKIRDDGKVDIEYKAWQTGEGVIQNELKQKMKVKQIGSQSQLLHGQIFKEGRDYDYDMDKIRHLYNPYIIELIEKLRRGEIE